MSTYIFNTQNSRKASLGIGILGNGSSYPRGPTLIAQKLSANRGPCGINASDSRCSLIHKNLFTLLLTNASFKTMFEELQAIGLTVKRVKDLSTHASSKTPGGRYDPVTNSLELPSSIYESENEIKAAKSLRLIAHEVRHAYQYRSVNREANKKGGSDEQRALLIAKITHDMGQQRHIEQSLQMEKKAEEYALATTLKILKDEHPGLIAYREIFGLQRTPSQYYNWEISSWWDANHDTYLRETKISWKVWEYIYKTGDYKLENFSKNPKN